MSLLENPLQGVSEKYPTCVYIFAPERSIGLCGVWCGVSKKSDDQQRILR